MAITLETLLLEFKGDFTQFDKELDTASKKASDFGKKLEKPYKISFDTKAIDTLNKKLDHSVDLMTRLGKQPQMPQLKAAPTVQQSMRAVSQAQPAVSDALKELEAVRSRAVDQEISAKNAIIDVEADQTEDFKKSVEKFARQQGLVGVIQKKAAENTVKSLEQQYGKQVKDVTAQATAAATGALKQPTDAIKKSVSEQKLVPEKLKQALRDAPKPEVKLTKMEALMTRQVSLTDSIKKILDAKQKLSPVTGRQSSFREFSQRADRLDPNIAKKELIDLFKSLVPEMRAAGTRKGETATQGGIKALMTRFPELESKAGMNNRKLKELQKDLIQNIEALIDSDSIEKLNEIASFMVSEWSKLARTPRTAKRGGGAMGRTPEKVSNTDAIEKNWDKTSKHIEKKLKRLVKVTKKDGYEIQKNVSEGSPGVTANIRENWDKTINFVSNRIEDLKKKSSKVGEDVQGSFGNFGDALKGELSEGMKSLGKMTLAGGLILGGLAAAGAALGNLIADSIGMAITKIGELMDASVDAAAAMETLKIRYDFIFGEVRSADILADLTEQTNALGLSVRDAKENFASFAATMEGSGLQESSLEIFNNFQKMMSISGGSSAQQAGMLTALTQMMSKGTVQAEELTGQLAERMPQALGIAAKAMGMSKTELLDYVKTGRLLSNEFIPKFTAAMGQMADVFLQTAPEPFEAKLQKLNNTFGMISTEIGKGSIDMLKPMIDGLNEVLLTVFKFRDEIVKVGAAIGLAIASPIINVALQGVMDFVKLASAASNKLFVKLRADMKTTEAMALTTQQKLSMGFNKMAISAKNFGKSMITMGASIAKALAPVVAAFAAIELISGAIDFANVEGVAQADKAAKRLELVRAAREGRAPSENVARTGNLLFDAIDRAFNEPIQRLSEMTGMTRNVTIGEAFQTRRVNQSQRELDALFQTTSEIINNVSDLGGLQAYIEQRAAIERDIEDLAATITALRSVNVPEAKERATELQRQADQRQRDLQEVEKRFFATGDFQVELEKMQEKIESLKKVIEDTGDPTGELTVQLKAAQAEEERLTKITRNLNQAIKDAKDNFDTLGKTLSAIQIREDVRRFEASRTTATERRNILQQSLAGGGSAQDRQLGLAAVEVNQAFREVEILRQSIAEADKAVRESLDSSTAKGLTELFKQFDENITGLDDATFEVLKTVSEQADLKGQQKTVVDALLKQKQKQVDLINAEEKYTQAQINVVEQRRQQVQSLRSFQRSVRDLGQSIGDYFKNQQKQLKDFTKQAKDLEKSFTKENKDFIKEYQNFNKSLNKQLREAGNELELLGKEIVNTELINEARRALGASGESMFEGFIDLAEGIFQSELDINERQLTLEEQRIQAEENILQISEDIEDLSDRRAEIEENRYRQLEDLADQQRNFQEQQRRSWNDISDRVEDMRDTAESMGITFTTIGDTLAQASVKLQAAVDAMQAPTMATGTGTGTGVDAFDPLLDLIMKGEGGFGSLNRGVAGDSMGQTLQQYFGRELKDIPLREIMEEQAKKNLFAVGAFQFIPETLKEAVQRSGISLDEGFTADVQKQLAIDLMKNKRPEVARFLETGQGLIEAAQGMAREWASIGLSRPEAGRGVGQSRYAGTGGNAASISPQEVQAALQAVRANLTNTQEISKAVGGIAPAVKGIDFTDPSKQSSGFYDTRIRRGQKQLHAGADFAIPTGTPISAPVGGKVESVYSDRGEFGVKIRTIDGVIQQQINHLDTISVKVGEIVQTGQQIGTSGGGKGSFGSTGPHLDLKFKVRGQFVPVEDFYKNPAKYLGNTALPVTTEDVSKLQTKATETGARESDRMAAREAREATRLKQDQLRTERDIFQANRQLEQALENVAGSYNNILSNVDEYITKSKGLLNNEEKRKQVLKSLDKEYQDQIKPIEELQQQISGLLEVEDKDTLNKSLEGIKQRFEDMPNLTDKAKESLAEMLELMGAGEIGLEGISGELNELLNQVKDAKAVREEFELGQFDTERRRAFDRPMEDVQLEIDREKAMSLFGDNVMVGIEFDERQAELELQRTLEDLEGQLDPSQIEAYGAKLRELNEIKFDKLRAEASDAFQMMQGLASGFEGAMSNLFTGLGDALFNQGEIEEKRGQANVEYAEKVMEIQEKYADNPEQMQKSLQSLKELNEIKMDGLEEELGQTAGVMGLLKNVVLDFTKSIVQSFAQIAAQKLTQSLFGGLLGGLGGGGGGLFGIFKYGGEVGGTGQDGLSQAMAKEGFGALPIVAHKGEQVLTDRNGDAQFFRSLKKSGEWARMKQGAQVANYNMGGPVGSASIQPMSQYYNNNSKSNNVRNISNYNVQVQSSNDLGRSMSQIRSAEQRRNQETYDKDK